MSKKTRAKPDAETVTELVALATANNVHTTRATLIERKDAFESRMSHNELMVNTCIAEGKSVKAAADECGVPVHTAYRLRNTAYIEVCHALDVIECGATRLQRVLKLQQVVERSFDENDPRWFNPKTGLAALRMLSELAGDLTPQVNTAPQVSIILANIQHTTDGTAVMVHDHEPAPALPEKTTPDFSGAIPITVDLASTPEPQPTQSESKNAPRRWGDRSR